MSGELSYTGTVALRDRRTCGSFVLALRLDRGCEFAERGLQAAMLASVHAEFIVASSDVLHQRMTAHHNTYGPVRFKLRIERRRAFSRPWSHSNPIVRLRRRP